MSRDSTYFKKIQMSLFDFINPNPIDKFKNKDLLGPLKYLNSESLEDSNLINDNAIQKNFETSKSLVDPKLYENYILNMPLIVHRKPYLRHIRFYVKPNSTIHVVAPMNRPIDLIIKEVSEHKLWIEKCNLKFQKLRDQFPVKVFQSGERLPFLGENFELKLNSAEFKKPFIQLDLDQLQYFYPQSWDLTSKVEKQSLLKKHLMKFYQEKAALHLSQRVRILSEQTQLFPKRLGFRNQKTRWGSCSSDGTLNLNWKLIAFDEALIDYVVIHELCHIKHPNHSKRFWALVENHCPEYKRLNKQLNQVQFEVDFLAPESELYFSNPKLV